MERQIRLHPEILRAGYFGSYARGDWGVGSDLDLIVIVRRSDQPFGERAQAWDTLNLPVPVDLLVYTQDEWQSLLERGARFPQVVEREAVWVYPRPVTRSLRLPQDTVRELSDVFSEYLQDVPDARVLLFGSRADAKGKGGDLDFIVIANLVGPRVYELKKKLRMAIKERLGDQRVDVLIVSDERQETLSSFVRLALMDGVQIWP